MSEVWIAEWCPCIYESGYQVISVHSSAKGAYKAMKTKLIERHNEMRANPFLKGGKLDESCRARKYKVVK